MNPVRVELGERSYDILIGAEMLDRIGPLMVECGLKGRTLIVTNPAVNELYGARARRSLAQAAIEAETFEFPSGEEQKHPGTVMRGYDFLIERNYSRATTILALGGGVVGDVAGFLAATYMRGVRFVQVPTTLLAMVDSSVGGKTGVNHPLAKNIIGAFYQPQLVVADPKTLRTLPRSEFRAGYAEVIKYGVIWDEALFASLEENLEQIFALAPELIGEIVRRSCEIKAEVVSRDERESSLRAILNFGHTFGHALEAITQYRQYLHGEAVAVGMVAAARTAEKMGMLEAAACARIEKHIGDAGLPTRFPAMDTEAFLARFSKDKKAVEGKIRFILPERIGKVVICDDVPLPLTREVVKEMSC
ncbi:MAG: 3-dehydroquinate synthase [Candidatus Sumerlaeota bacterium]|nr:3-dehydroquinate synthase [Candidatus Sumerlaeota bacterium]